MACPVCCSYNIKQIYSGIDRVITKFSDNYTPRLFLFRCYDCGMLFLDRIDYDLRIVHDSYWKMLVNNLGDNCSIDTAESQDSLLSSLSAYKKEGTLLEIGCGEGRFLQLAQSRGWRVTGIEFSSEAAHIARDKYGLDVLIDPPEEAYKKLKELSFDAVVMWGVIEHLPNPINILKIIKLLLRKDGALVIFTLNANSIFHRLARMIFSSTGGLMKFPMERLIIAMHVMYFNPYTLQKAITECDFLVRRVEMRDIDIDFVFKAHSNFRWSNRISRSCAKFLQKVSHFDSMHSHMMVFAESI